MHLILLTVPIKFELTRMKIYFEAVKKNGKIIAFGGELIDVSIPHRDQTSVRHFFDHLRDNIATYTLRYGLNIENRINEEEYEDQDQTKGRKGEIKFISSSLSYLSQDLEYILFTFNEFPWQDEKYAKRLNRLMYLYFVDIFVESKSYEGRRNVLRNLEFFIEDPKSRFNNFVKTYKSLNISQFAAFLIRIEEKVEEKSIERDGYGEFIQVILQNIKFFKTILSGVKNYCTTDGFARSESIYQADINNFQ